MKKFLDNDGLTYFWSKIKSAIPDVSNKLDKVSKLGSTTKPVYTSAAGTFAECSTYAGGTNVTLNGSDKGGSTASFYAPTAAGTSGLILVSNGSGAPTWGDETVTGVKGDNESSYRIGTINITKDNIGLGNVGNFKAVSTVASLGLTSTEKSNARTNIGAGTSSFSGSYTDLTNKPTIPSAANNGTFSIKTKVGSSSAVTVSDFTANQSSADDITFVQGNNVTLTTDAINRTITVEAIDTTYNNATSSSSGLMSSSDKTKLDELYILIYNSVRLSVGLLYGGYTVTLTTNAEWAYVLTDLNNKILAGVRQNGSLYIAEL